MSLITCPECKKGVSDTASVCPKCGFQFTTEKMGELKAKSKKGKTLKIIIGILVLFFIIGYFASKTGGPSGSSGSGGMTMAMFEQIQNGMTEDQVFAIVGQKGTASSEGSGVKILTYEGSGDIGANALVTFQGGKVVNKAQANLK